MDHSASHDQRGGFFSSRWNIGTRWSPWRFPAPIQCIKSRSPARHCGTRLYDAAADRRSLPDEPIRARQSHGGPARRACGRGADLQGGVHGRRRRSLRHDVRAGTGRAGARDRQLPGWANADVAAADLRRRHRGGDRSGGQAPDRRGTPDSARNPGAQPIDPGEGCARIAGAGNPGAGRSRRPDDGIEPGRTDEIASRSRPNSAQTVGKDAPKYAS